MICLDLFHGQEKTPHIGKNSSGEDITGYIRLELAGNVKATANLADAKKQNNYNGSTGYWTRLNADISGYNTSKQCIIGTNGNQGAYIHMFLANMYMYSFK